MSDAKKTNAMRILESMGIPFQTDRYEFDEDALDAVTAAGKLGIEAGRVFKTIVMRTDENEICVFCVPADREVSLKKARAASGAREIAPVKGHELLALTGYVRGGCSPIGMKKRYRVFIDETAVLYDRVHVSAGLRGIQLVISGDDLARAADAVFADIALEAAR
jgi:Cys-tRNA(Pro)/Cys-tRNA(Cys) deacylase